LKRVGTLIGIKFRAIDMTTLELPGFTHIEKQRFFTLRVIQPGP
jgi:hypothetical protein